MVTKLQGSSSSKVVYRQVENLGDYPQNITNYGTIDDRNVITYDDGPQHNVDWTMRWKQCQHSWYCGREGVLSFRHAWKTGKVMRKGQYTFFMPESYQTMVQNLRRWESLTPPGDEALLATVVNEMSGRLKGTELPITDVFQLYTSVKKHGNPAEELVKPFYDLFRRKPKNLRDLIKKVSGADLARKFGLVPLVKTLFSILNAAQVVDAHLKKLSARELSDQLNFSVTSTPYDVVHATGDAVFRDVGSSVRAKASYIHRTRMTCKVFFRTTVDYDTSDSIHTKLLWDAYGVSNIFGTVWDVLPYSFVVDWFYNLGEVCAQMDNYLFHTSPLVRLGKLTDVWASIVRRTSYELSGFTAVQTSSTSRTEGFSPPEVMALSSGQFLRRPVASGNVGNFLQTLSVGGQPLTCAQTVTGLELLVQRAL